MVFRSFQTYSGIRLNVLWNQCTNMSFKKNHLKRFHFIRLTLNISYINKKKSKVKREPCQRCGKTREATTSLSDGTISGG